MEEIRELRTSSSACVKMEYLHSVLEWSIVPPCHVDMLKTVAGRSKVMEVFLSSWIVLIAFEAFILPHLLLAVTCVMKRKAVSAHMPPAPPNMIGSEVLTVYKSFMQFAWVVDGKFMAQMVALHLVGALVGRV